MSANLTYEKTQALETTTETKKAAEILVQKRGGQNSLQSSSQTSDGVQRLALTQFDVFKANQSKVTNPVSETSINYLKALLEEAYLEKNYQKQCALLIDIAVKHLALFNYADAAKLLNGALAILEQQYELGGDGNYVAKEAKELEILLLQKLSEVDKCFFQEKLKIQYSPETYGRKYRHKLSLIEIREWVKKGIKEFSGGIALNNNEKLEEFHKFTEALYKKIIEFLSKIFEECLTIVGPCPCEYALVGMGSLARQEITPYSDLECFLLVEKDNNEIKEFFKKVCLLLELKIINLGETDLVKGCELLPELMLNPTRKGFSFDVHKNPQQSEGELIGTPFQVAKYQMSENFINEPTNHLSLSLLNCSLVCGSSMSQNLLNQYFKCTNDILDVVDVETRQSLRVNRCLATLGEDLDHFLPRLKIEDQGSLLDVKSDLYRLPQTILDALALGLDIPLSNTWDRINALQNIFITDKKATNYLKWLIAQTHLWRLETYSHYDQQKEFIDIFIRVSKNILIKNPNKDVHQNDLNVLSEIYKVLIPLHGSVVKFHQFRGDRKALSEAVLYDDSSFSSGLIAERLFQYEMAVMHFETTLKEASARNDLVLQASAYHRLSLVCQHLGQRTKALDSGEKALQMRRSMDPIDEDSVASSFNNLGTVLLDLGRYAEAMKYFEDSLKTTTAKWGEDNIRVCRNLANLATIWSTLGFPLKAVGFLEQAQRIAKLYKDNIDLNLDFGVVLLKLGQFQKAIEYFEQDIKFKRKKYGVFHPKLASSFVNLAVAKNLIGEFKGTTEFFENELEIVSNTYGKKHPRVVLVLIRLGDHYREIDHFDKALEHFFNALKLIEELDISLPEMTIDIYNKLALILTLKGRYSEAENYSKVALKLCEKVSHAFLVKKSTAYSNLGMINQFQDQYEEAEACFQQALNIMKEMDYLDPNTSKLLNNITQNLLKRGAIERAMQYLKQALEINIQVYGLQHPELGVTHFNLGDCFRMQEKFKEAIEPYLVALKIFIGAFGETNLQVAITYNNLGLSFYGRNLFEKSKQAYENAIKTFESIFPNQHPELATTYNNLAGIYKVEGNLMDSLKYYELAKKVYVKFNGKNHSSVAICLSNMGVILNELSRHQEALTLFEEAYPILVKVFHEEHDTIATLYHNEAISYVHMRDFGKAKDCFKKSLEIKRKLYGEKQQTCAQTLSSLAEIFEVSGDKKEALDRYQQALAIYEETDPKNLAICLVLEGLARIESEGNNNIKAEAYYKRALTVLSEAGVKQSLDFARAISGLGLLYIEMGNKDREALECFVQAYDISHQILGESHPETQARLQIKTTLLTRLAPQPSGSSFKR